MKSIINLLLLFMISLCSAMANDEKQWNETLNFVVKVKKESQRTKLVETGIIEASSPAKQGWLSHPRQWILANENEHQDYRYFLYTTSPQANRTVCEELAYARAVEMIIDVLPLEKRKKIKQPALIQGAQQLKSYWKLIRYKSKGPETKEETTGRATICSALLKISVKNLIAISATVPGT